MFNPLQDGYNSLHIAVCFEKPFLIEALLEFVDVDSLTSVSIKIIVGLLTNMNTVYPLKCSTAILLLLLVADLEALNPWSD
jgi:hypothetical protein